MRNYTTQMDAARRGLITPEMKEVLPGKTAKITVGEGSVLLIKMFK